MSEDKLLSMLQKSKSIKNNRKREWNNLFQSKREEIKGSVYKPKRDKKSLFKLKREKIKKSLYTKKG